MSRSSLLWVLGGLMVNLLPIASLAAAKARYPQIRQVTGTPALVEEAIKVEKREAISTEKLTPLKKTQVLRDKAQIRTPAKSTVKIDLNAQDSMTIFENSELVIPVISWEDGAFRKIEFDEGSFRYTCHQRCDRMIESPLFEFEPAAGDYIFKYDPKIPRIEVSVLEGSLNFRGLGNESFLDLKAGEKAAFTGVLEDGEILYDVLLKGRKVAKGKLEPTQKIPEDFVRELKKEEERQIKAARKKPAPKRTEAQICEKPFGELNQCAWICENNPKKAGHCAVEKGAKCARWRCNANGVWSDRMEVPGAHCKPQSFAGTCDY